MCTEPQNLLLAGTFREPGHISFEAVAAVGAMLEVHASGHSLIQLAAQA